MKTYNTIFRALFAVVPLYILLCTGGSTEIGNARAVITGSITDNGRNVDSAQVQLVAEDYIPGNPTADKVFSTLTNCRGDYRFEEVPLGNYYLNAKATGKRLLRGPIEIAETEKDLTTDPLQETSQLTISIPESSAVNVVFVQGVAQTWNVTSGTVVLDSVPSGAVTVVGFTQSGQVPKSLSSDNSVKMTVDVMPEERAVATFDNAPPRILTSKSELPGVVSRTDGTYNVIIYAEDPEGEAVSFALLAAPQGMSIDNVSGKITWQTGDSTTAGDYRVGVRVTDAKDASSSLSWTITVVERRIFLLSAASTASGYVRRSYLFEIDTSLSPNANASRFSWGDGDTTSWQAAAAASHFWKSTGTFLVSFQVQYASDGSFSQWSAPLIMEISASYDTIPPVIEILGGDTVMIPLSDPNNQLDYYLTQVRATDESGGPVTALEPQSNVNLFNINTVPYTIVYTFIDTSGNRATATRYVFIYRQVEIDVTPPIISIGEDTVYVQLGQTFIEPSAAAWDNFDGSITDKIVKSGTVDVTRIGGYSLTYSVKDAAGNTTSVIRTVIVQEGPIVEPSFPVIILRGRNPDTVVVYSDTGYIDPGATALDAKDGDITNRIIVTESVNMRVIGKYMLYYTVTDLEGHTVRTTRVVNVVDTAIDATALMISLLGRNPDTVIVGSDSMYHDPGATAADNRGVNLTSAIIVTGKVDMGSLGKYVLMYSVKNDSSASATIQRTVWVVRDPVTTDLLVRYGVPGNGPIPDLSGKTYMKFAIDGDGPDPDSIGGLFIYWSLTYDTLNTLFLMFIDEFSNDTLVTDLKSKIQHTFSSNSPAIKLAGTGFPGLDGEYYVGVSSNEMYWVEQSGKYAIIWEE